MPSWIATDPRQEALEALADALDSRQFATTLVTGNGRVPHLYITSRYAKISENVYADSDFYWYSWAERIAPVGAVAGAAAKVTALLSTVAPASHG